jgi:Fe-S cluster biogenesis protein NfuA
MNHFEDRLQEVYRLVEELKSAPDSSLRTSALELLQTVLEFHGAGLNRMMEIIDSSVKPAQFIIEALGRDSATSAMLLLHGLHPEEIDVRVRRALDSVRPLLSLHGGDVELLEVQNGVVRLRLTGSCNGCASSATTIHTAVETAIRETAPDISHIEVTGGQNAAHLRFETRSTAPAN